MNLVGLTAAGASTTSGKKNTDKDPIVQSQLQWTRNHGLCCAIAASLTRATLHVHKCGATIIALAASEGAP
jgi:hypothetical protein